MRAGESERGFTYLTLLFVIAAFGLGLAVVGQMVSAATQRDREAALIRTGSEVTYAITAYYYASPGAVRKLPRTWDDLIDDRRFVSMRRHLRRVPMDPMTGRFEWRELRDPDGSLVGIASLSEQTPFRTTPISAGRATIPPGSRYSDWQFRFVPEIEWP